MSAGPPDVVLLGTGERADTSSLPDLAGVRSGGSIVACTDEFFGYAARLISGTAPVARPRTYDEHGQWMDGWESRRHRAPDSDEVVVRLGAPCRVRSIVVDTAFFSGNQPERAVLDGAHLPGNPSPQEVAGASWFPLVPATPLRSDDVHELPVDAAWRTTHVRLRIEPDGGVARLRVHGEVLPDPRELDGLPLDLAAGALGATVEASSDMHFGDRRNLVAPGEAQTMGEGWETRRRRVPGADWARIRLLAEGLVRRVVVDTRQFRGNAPRSCDVEASVDGQSWTPLLSGVRLQPDQVHRLAVPDPVPAGWLRLTVHPDGGVARLHALGTLTGSGRRALADRFLSALPEADLVELLLEVCGSHRWAQQVASRRPAAVDLPGVAAQVWAGLDPADWEEALAAHPRIGERPAAGTQERREQAAVDSASDELLARIDAGNRAYEQRFGRTYVVRARGRSGEQMLSLLERRLALPPEDELREAAAQQAEITALRLTELLEGPA